MTWASTIGSHFMAGYPLGKLLLMAEFWIDEDQLDALTNEAGKSTWTFPVIGGIVGSRNAGSEGF
jgi:hypothetical protein